MAKLTVEEALKLAQSPAGQELLTALQSKSPDIAAKAENLVRNGNREAAQEVLKKAADDPKIQELLKKITL